MSSPPVPRVVAHIVDRVTGGVPVAVRTYIENSSPLYAHVVVSPCVRDAPGPEWNSPRVRHIAWDTSSPLRAVLSLGRILRKHRFDVVHAHSSFPGTYVRLLRSGARTRVVYTPHGFAFARTDVSGARRTLFRTAERMLAPRTTFIAACGPGELRQARALGVRPERSVEVPNLSSVSVVPHLRPAATGSTLRVGMLGRWAPQKDPEYFLARIGDLRAALPEVRVEATWIGDGDPSAAHGLRVTGWVGLDRVGAELADLDVYLHTAAWEGFPIAILDAAAAGIPILARRIAALPDLPAGLRMADGVAELITAVRTGGFVAWSARNRAMWRDYLGPRDATAQREALARAWG